MRGKTAVIGAVALILVTCAFAGTATQKTKKKPSVTFTTLYNFTDSTTDGAYIFGSPVVAVNGNIFGTAETGGANGYGTVWSLSSSGSISVLHSFDYTDGGYPFAGLTLQNASANGNMWGTTANGGTNGEGTVFEITSGGTFTSLYSFGASGDPEYIYSDVVVGPNGSLYGTGEEGGADGYGGIWQVTSGGTETVLASFDYTNYGAYPFLGNLHRDAAGDFFGVAEEGGSDGCGTLYELSAGGTLSVLHNFDCSTDGEFPTGNILEYKGNLYGTAEDGGANGEGTVWQYNISTATFTVLHSFGGSDGGIPLGGVGCQEGKKTVCAGNLFGTTEAGGSSGYGTVWEISSGGTFTTLHNFAETDGAYPYGRPFVTKSGDVYGTTYYGGSSGYGTLWEITGAGQKVHAKGHKH